MSAPHHSRPRARALGRGAGPVVAAALAFFASQHHNLHMLALAVGLGGAGGSFLQTYPWLRRGMLLISVAVVAINVIGLRHRPPSPAVRVWVLAFVALTALLVVWSLVQFGI